MGCHGFLGLRFTRSGPLNEDLGRLMSAVLSRQMRRSPRYFRAFFMGAPKTLHVELRKDVTA
jgi:hypothetical protein